MCPEVELEKISRSEKWFCVLQRNSYSSGRRGSGRKFCHADADKEDSNTCDGPTPDHCDRSTILKGIDKDGGYGGQETYYAEGDSEDLEGSKLAPKLLLVTQTGEERLVCLTILVLHGGGREKRTIYAPYGIHTH
jgi:hypothetical protein